MDVPFPLVTFRLREHFPGLKTLLEATNVLVASKEFSLRISTDSEAHDMLSICVYSRRADTPTLSIRAPLDDSVSQESVLQLDRMLKRSAKKSLSENFFLFSDDDISITVNYSTFEPKFLSSSSTIPSQDIVHRHEYSFRKPASGIWAVISAITILVNLRNESGYLYSFQASLDNIESRWFRLNLKHRGQCEATVMLRRKLKSVTNEDRRNLSLLNFASAFDAPIMLQCEDDIHLQVLIGIPDDPEKWDRLLLNMSYLI